MLLPPMRGLVTAEALAAARPGGALRLENWFPTKTGARLRGGSAKYATISTGPVLRMFTYKSGSLEKFFASDATKVFDVTSVADPAAIPSPAISGQTSGYYSTAQMATAGGDFLSICNGTDTPRYFDGTAWAAHTLTGYATPAAFNFNFTFLNRLWFIPKDSRSVYYLGVDAINGALTEFSLNGVFQEGGFLVGAYPWSRDSGSGLDDNLVFVSSTGEVAVYQGDNPSVAAQWQKVGIYQITPPLGPNAIMRAGGDLLLAVEAGIVPLSKAVETDVAGLSLASTTAKIEPDWKVDVVARKTLPWEIVKWPINNMAIVSLPIANAGLERACWVVNLETGGWAKFTGWDTRCIAHYDGYGYFGTNDGTIHRMEVGGSDDGIPYVCTYIGLPDHLKEPGVHKVLHSVRSVFRASTPFKAKVSASVGYNIQIPQPPASVADFATYEWDSGLWDQATWDSAGALVTKSIWASVGRSGFVISPQVQVTCATGPFPRVELIASDVIYETGNVMV
jgi:hypothetical protein